jgi:2-C-methyl-D-erythritol 4-phosphate cytidylyltransferase
MTSSRFFALIPAAGVGARMAVDYPKQYLPLGGKPMLLHVLETFALLQSIAHTYVVVSPGDRYIRSILQGDERLHGRVTILYNGGATRHESVLNGLHTICDKVADEDWILVHDAARPGLTHQLIDKLITSLRNDEVGGLLAMPIVDTVKQASSALRVQTTVPREQLWAAQTPQMFRYSLLTRALREATNVTDEASAIEALGLQPKLVEGGARNFKVTLPHDVALAELYLKGLV